MSTLKKLLLHDTPATLDTLDQVRENLASASFTELSRMRSEARLLEQLREAVGSWLKNDGPAERKLLAHRFEVLQDWTPEKRFP